MNDRGDACLAALLRFASLGFHGHLLPRLAWLHAAPTPTPISCWFWLPETQISVLLKAPLPPQFSQPAMALASLPPSLQRRPHAVASDDAKGGDELEAATAYLARKPVFRPYR